MPWYKRRMPSPFWQIALIATFLCFGSMFAADDWVPPVLSGMIAVHALATGLGAAR